MLDALRKRATGWIAQLFIVLLVLSFAVWGVSDVFTGFGTDTVATVGKTEISTVEFARQYDQALQNLSRQTGRPITTEQAQLFGLPGQVLGRLITQATLDETARQYGLGISNETLARKIAEDPSFRGPAGTFDRLYFQQALRNVGLTEDQYIEDRQDVFLRYQISDALFGGGSTPEAYLRALHDFRTEQRDISYIALTAADAGEIAEPSDTELTAYFEENKAQWSAPEYRALRYFEVSPADIAKPDAITDAEAQAKYDADIDQYTKPEQRTVSQIHFDSEDDAVAAAAAIEAGKTFDEIATERQLSASDVSLGQVTRDQIIDDKVAEIAFSLDPKSTSDPVQSDFGWFIVRVEDIQPGNVTAFDTAKDEIRNEMALQLATRRIIETYDQVEDARAGGETLTEIAAKIGVPLRTEDAVDRSGNGTDGRKIADLPGGNELLAGAFESDVDLENDAIRTADNGYVWYEVTAITPERDRTLDEVRAEIVAAWKNAQADKALTAKAEDMRTRAAGGESLADIAVAMNLQVRAASGLTRTSQPPSGLSPAAIAAAFDGPQGYAAVAPGAAGTVDKIVLAVTGSSIPPFEPSAAQLAETRKQISDQIANDLLQQFLVEMQEQHKVSVNQAALQSIVGQQGSGI
jgi:peptidyl-prolyl cis-trans isomerase D